MSAQTDIFRRRVRDSLGAQPPSAPAGLTVSEALARLSATGDSGLVLVDGAGRPTGILTEADVARRVALKCDGGEAVSAVMTAPVVTVGAGEYLYRAIAVMRRKGLRHLPVTGPDGTLAGMLHLDDAVSALSADLVSRIDRLTGDGSIETQIAVKEAEIEIAADLQADGAPVADILGLITHVNNDLYGRVADGILREMPGEAPAGFAVIVMGSGGRGENFLYPDQDNGLIIADYPDSDHDRIDGWFIDFADRLTARMDAIGFPYCKGYVMATNPLWRKMQRQWLDQLDIWMRRRSVAAVMLSDIFFDFRAVAGETALAGPLRDRITEGMQTNHMFLREILEKHEGMRSALGLFGRFRTERNDQAHRGSIHLKYYGTQPIIAAVRLLALRHGVAAVPTLGRIDGLAAAGVLDENESAELPDAFNTVCDMLLRAQIAAHQAGRPVTNYVAPSSLRRAERQDLRAAFRTIDALCDRVRADFTGEVF